MPLTLVKWVIDQRSTVRFGRVWVCGKKSTVGRLLRLDRRQFWLASWQSRVRINRVVWKGLSAGYNRRWGSPGCTLRLKLRGYHSSRLRWRSRSPMGRSRAASRYSNRLISRECRLRGSLQAAPALHQFPGTQPPPRSLVLGSRWSQVMLSWRPRPN